MSEIEAGENYSLVRNRLALTEWSEDTQLSEDRPPTNAEILRLLDALHADIQGTVGTELSEHRSDRWFNS